MRILGISWRFYVAFMGFHGAFMVFSMRFRGTSRTSMNLYGLSQFLDGLSWCLRGAFIDFHVGCTDLLVLSWRFHGAFMGFDGTLTAHASQVRVPGQ